MLRVQLHRARVHRAAQQVEQVGGGGLLAEAALEVGDCEGPVAQPLPAVVAAGQLDRGGEQHRLQRLLVRALPPTGAAARCSGPRRSPRGGCSAPARRAGCRLERDADVVGHDPLAATGRPRPDPVGLVEVSPARAREPGAPEAGPAVPGGTGIQRLRLVDVLGLDLRHDDVVDDRRVARGDLHAAHELVCLEPRGRRGSTGSRRCPSPRVPWVCRRPATGCSGTAHPCATGHPGPARRPVMRCSAPRRARWRGPRRCAGRQGGPCRSRSRRLRGSGRGGGRHEASTHQHRVVGSGGGRGELAAGPVDVRAPGVAHRRRDAVRA